MRAAFSPAHPQVRRDVSLPWARDFQDRVLREHRRLSILSSPSYSRRSSLASFFSSLSGGVAKVPFTARIGRAHSYCARSASKKGTLAAPPSSYCWIPDSSHFPSWIRVKVQASPDSVGFSSLPSTM